MTHNELLLKWSWAVDQAREIPTWTEELTLAWLAEEASKAKVMVDLGVYMGASSMLMCVASPGSHIWGVDKFMVFGTEKVTKHYLRRYIGEGRYEVIVGDSARAAQMLQHMKGKIDLCFIDDGHAEEDLVRDITSMLPLMRPGGILCGHDFDVPHNDVARGVIQTGISYHLPVPRLWVHNV